jgi:hypothetical protein
VKIAVWLSYLSSAKSKNYESKVLMNKKIWVIAIFFAIIVGSISLYAETVMTKVVLRAGEVELTLYTSGTMEWYDGRKTVKGTYSLNTSQHRITIKEDDGTTVGTYRYTFPSTRGPRYVATIDFQDGLVLTSGISRN